MSSCHKQSAAYVAKLRRKTFVGYSGPRRIHLEQASNWGNEGCVPWLHSKESLNLGHPCCDETGLQMQPSKDATPELGRSTSCRWWPLLKLSLADFWVAAVHVTLQPSRVLLIWRPKQHSKLHDSRLARRLILCERSLKTPEARILPEANVQKSSTWRRHTARLVQARYGC